MPFFVLVACGGGSVNVNQLNYKHGKIPANGALDRLGDFVARADFAQAHEFLTTLAGEAGEKLDWEGFWDGLLVRPFRVVLFQKEKAALLTLHSRDCEAFPSYVKFLIDRRDGWDTLVGESRRCDRRLPPELAMSAAQTMVADHPELTPGAFHFIAAEMRHTGNGDGWATTFATDLPWIRQNARRLLDKGDLFTVLEMYQAQGESRAGDLALSELALIAVTEEGLRKQWFDKLGYDAGLARVVSALRNPGVPRPSVSGVAGFEAAARARLAEGEVDAAYLSRAARFAFAARELRRGQKLAERLAPWDRILEVAEQHSLTTSEQAGEPLFQNAYAAAADAPWAFELHWLAKRAANAALPLPPGTGQHQDEIESALALLESIDRGTSLAKQQALQTYCDYLATRGIPVQEGDAQALRARFADGSLLGCFRLREGSRLESETALSGALSSVIVADDADLAIAAPQVRLGGVFLRTLRRQPAPVPTPPSPKHNARAVPLLVGISLAQDSSRLKRGTHFFLLHFVDRQAAPGDPEPNAPLAGFAGPSLRLRSEQPVAQFAFVSLGGPGQAAVPPQPGGRPDKSTASVEELVGWLDSLSLSGRINVPRPLRFDSQLNYDLLDHLFSSGERTAEGVKIYLVPDFLTLLDQEQQTKWRAICEEESGAELTRAQLDACVKDRLTPRALDQIAALVQRSRTDGSLPRESLVPELNAEEVFRLRGASEGPLNPEGAEGPPGKLIFASEEEGETR